MQPKRTNIMQIEKIYDLSFDVAQVYRAWVANATVIPPATTMDINPVVGGHYRLIMETSDFSGRNEGVFSLVEPGVRLCYSWEWNNDGERTEIDVRFSATSTGCRVTLLHAGFASLDSAQRDDSRWDSYIEGFTAHLEANQSA